MCRLARRWSGCKRSTRSGSTSPCPRHLGKLKIGAPIELAVDAFPGQVFKGEIEAFDARVAQDTRTLMVRGGSPNTDRKLLPGMFANVAVLAGEAKDFVTVPRTAVTYSLYGDSVWVVKAGPPAPEKTASVGEAAVPAPQLTAERRFVRVGPTQGDRVAILEGVNAGEQVVTSGQLKFQPGATIKIDNSRPRSPPRRCPSNSPMHFTDIFIKRPVLATVVSLLILLIGAQAGFKLPIRQYPELSNTTITVTTPIPAPMPI